MEVPTNPSSRVPSHQRISTLDSHDNDGSLRMYFERSPLFAEKEEARVVKFSNKVRSSRCMPDDAANPHHRTKSAILPRLDFLDLQLRRRCCRARYVSMSPHLVPQRPILGQRHVGCRNCDVGHRLCHWLWWTCTGHCWDPRFSTHKPIWWRRCVLVVAHTLPQHARSPPHSLYNLRLLLV